MGNTSYDRKPYGEMERRRQLMPNYRNINGNTISSTWRTRLVYIVNETPTSFEIEANSFEVELTSSTYVLLDGTDATMTLKIGSQTTSLKYKDVHPLHNNFNSTRSEYIEYLSDYFSSSSKKVTIPKTTSTQNVTVSFAMYVKTWNKGTQKGDELIYGKDMSAATSTASVTLTVPALAKPTVMLTALRDDTDESTVLFTAIVSSFVDDNISSVKLTIGETEYDMGSGTIDSSGSLTFNGIMTGLSLNRISASLVATGLGGASNSYTLNVPAAFHTLDIGNKGKEIAFGQSAITDQSMIPSNGLFSCGMDADFQGSVSFSDVARTSLGLTDTGWVDLTTTKGTWSYCQYRYKNGVVYIRGYATSYAWSGSVGDYIVANETIPSQYRPLVDVDFVVRCGGTRWGQIVVNQNGGIYVDRILNGTTSYTTSSWIRFSVSYPI